MSLIYDTITDYHSDWHTLICVTPRRPCCKSLPNRFGEWLYPNRSVVRFRSSGNSFYRDRGDDGTVKLHRRGIVSLSAAVGEYCCEIPNTSDINELLCITFSKFHLATCSYCSSLITMELNSALWSVEANYIHSYRILSLIIFNNLQHLELLTCASSVVI